MEGTPRRRPVAPSVLLIDDAPFFRDMLAPVLKAAGYAVTAVGSAREALALLRGGRGFDVVITDVDMPDMDGFELAAALRTDARIPRTCRSSDFPRSSPRRRSSAARRSACTIMSPSSIASGLIAALKEQTDELGRAA